MTCTSKTFPQEKVLELSFLHLEWPKKPWQSIRVILLKQHLSLLHSSIDIDGFILQIFNGKYKELLHITSQPGLKNG